MVQWFHIAMVAVIYVVAILAIDQVIMKGRRRYRVRELLIFMTVISIIMGLFSWAMRR
jgi:hypothetical protein